MNVIFNVISSKEKKQKPNPINNYWFDFAQIDFRRNKFEQIRINRYFAPKGKIPPDLRIEFRFLFYKRGASGLGDKEVRAVFNIKTENKVLTEDIYNQSFAFETQEFPSEVYTYLWGKDYVLDELNILPVEEIEK